MEAPRTVPSIATRLQNAVDLVGDRALWGYAAVPMLTTLLRFDEARKVLAAAGFNVGLTLGFPLPVSTGWKFVSTSFGGGATVSGPTTAAGATTFVVGFLLQGVLTAGYLGGLWDGFRGVDRSFAANVRRYLLPFVGFGLLLTALFVPPVLVTLAGAPVGPVVVLWIVVTLVVSYLFYGAPYLIVVEDHGLLAALSRSLSLASTGPYARFAVGYAAVVLAVSLPATAVVANTGVLGVAVAVLVLAPVGLVFDAATLRFVADAVDRDAVAGCSAGDDELSGYSVDDDAATEGVSDETDDADDRA